MLSYSTFRFELQSLILKSLRYEFFCAKFRLFFVEPEKKFLERAKPAKGTESAAARGATRRGERSCPEHPGRWRLRSLEGMKILNRELRKQNMIDVFRFIKVLIVFSANMRR